MCTKRSTTRLAVIVLSRNGPATKKHALINTNKKGSLRSPFSSLPRLPLGRRGSMHSDCESLNAAVQAADLARGEVGVDDTLASSAVDFRLGSLERCESNGVITGGDGFFNLTDESAHAATTRLVDRGAGSNLAGGLLG